MEYDRLDFTEYTGDIFQVWWLVGNIINTFNLIFYRMQ